MAHLPDLIKDLSLILMAAAGVTLLCKKLKQPVILGYLIAGFLVSPRFTLVPSVKSADDISIWAEIGVIFMLFSLGLEFSFKKLARVGKSASITASFEIFAMLAAGFFAGQLLGWSRMDSLFLGGILSISSTTIIMRVFEELGLKRKSFVMLVFGALIVEDLIAILLLVLLSSVAATKSLSGVELVFTASRLVFFLVLWFLLGIYLLPVAFKKLSALFSDETLLIVSIGLCLTMVMVASRLGFSPALGAFVMGSLLAETPKGHRIERLILPVKDLFSAVFFVSVGMLIDPKVLSEYFWVIMLMTALTIFGKFTSTTIGALISGRNLKSSVKAGMSLAQIGEFSFIVATLGMTLKVTSDFLYPIAVAISAITAFTTPYLIKYSDRFYDWLDGRIPQRMKESLSKYEAAMSKVPDESIFSLMWKEHGVKIALNSILIIAIALLMSRLALPQIQSFLGKSVLMDLLACGVTLVLTGPFFWAVFIGSARGIERMRWLEAGVVIIRLLIGCVLAGFVVNCFVPIASVQGVGLIAVACIGAFFVSRFSAPLYRKIEGRFISNLADEKATEPKLAPWGGALAEFTLSSNSPLIAKALQESAIKERFGVTIVMIERGESRILAPAGSDLLLPGDKLFLIGTDEQLSAAGEIIEKEATMDLPPLGASFGLTSFVVTPVDRFVNRSIRECGLRKTVNGLIVGVERDGKRYLNPDSAMKLLADDLVWIVGDLSLIKELRA